LTNPRVDQSAMRVGSSVNCPVTDGHSQSHITRMQISKFYICGLGSCLV